MNEAEVRGYQVALSEERVQLVLKLAAGNERPTGDELRRLADLQAAIAAFQAVLDRDVPGEIYKHHTLK